MKYQLGAKNEEISFKARKLYVKIVQIADGKCLITTRPQPIFRLSLMDDLLKLLLKKTFMIKLKDIFLIFLKMAAKTIVSIISQPLRKGNKDSA